MSQTHQFREWEIAAPPASSKFSTSKNSAVATKLKSTESTKKPSRGNNFFERFKKVGSEGSQSTETVQRHPATIERDSRPFLFKFNEVHNYYSSSLLT